MRYFQTKVKQILQDTSTDYTVRLSRHTSRSKKFYKVIVFGPMGTCVEVSSNNLSDSLARFNRYSRRYCA